jgi:DNA helicase II / ATP-dependent DNA helicase PcrA
MEIPNSRSISSEWEELYLNASIRGSVMFTGPPGTGKTLIAFFRARELAEKKIEPHVLMFGNVLKRYTDNATGKHTDRIKSDTLLSWIKTWWSDHRIKINGSYDPPEISKFNPDWGLMLGEMAIRVSDEQPIRDWKHLIIDEAQDFPESMFSFLRFVSRHMKNGGITILADENQRLYENNSSLNEIKKALAIPESNCYQLTENFRNTKEIALLAAHFYAGLPTGIPDIPSRRGEVPELYQASSLNNQIAYIIKSLKIKGYAHVGVFTQFDKVREIILGKLQSALKGQYHVQSYSSISENKGKYPARNLVFDKAGTVTVINQQSCKGLEFDAVFIPEIQSVSIDESNLDVFKMNMYVMCSRARVSLCLLYSSTGEDLPRIIKYLPNLESGIINQV